MVRPHSQQMEERLEAVHVSRYHGFTLNPVGRRTGSKGDDLGCGDIPHFPYHLKSMELFLHFHRACLGTLPLAATQGCLASHARSFIHAFLPVVRVTRGHDWQRTGLGSMCGRRGDHCRVFGVSFYLHGLCIPSYLRWLPCKYVFPRLTCLPHGPATRPECGKGAWLPETMKVSYWCLYVGNPCPSSTML